jgi:hypothetical protein
MLPPDPEERGFKDTVKANPGYFTTIRARFDLPQGVTVAADVRLPLPHHRARGQRHDAAIHGGGLSIAASAPPSLKTGTFSPTGSGG